MWVIIKSWEYRDYAEIFNIEKTIAKSQSLENDDI